MRQDDQDRPFALAANNTRVKRKSKTIRKMGMVFLHIISAVSLVIAGLSTILLEITRDPAYLVLIITSITLAFIAIGSINATQDRKHRDGNTAAIMDAIEELHKHMEEPKE